MPARCHFCNGTKIIAIDDEGRHLESLADQISAAECEFIECPCVTHGLPPANVETLATNPTSEQMADWQRRLK